MTPAARFSAYSPRCRCCKCDRSQLFQLSDLRFRIAQYVAHYRAGVLCKPWRGRSNCERYAREGERPTPLTLRTAHWMIDRMIQTPQIDRELGEVDRAAEGDPLCVSLDADGDPRIVPNAVAAAS